MKVPSLSQDPASHLPAQPAKAGQSSQVLVPSEDLKPLYDFALDCKACQARLVTAQGDLADEKTKTQTLSRERDAALRIAHAAKWFAMGAAAGAIAARAAH